MSAVKQSAVLRYFIVFAAMVSFAVAAGADAVPRTVVKPGELTTQGIGIRRRQHQTPSASLELKIAVGPDAAIGEFKSAELVVLKEPTADDLLPTVDATPADSPVFDRRTSSDKTEIVFLVLGREVSRSYLAINIASSPVGPAHRYLLPVLAVKNWKPKADRDASETP